MSQFNAFNFLRFCLVTHKQNKTLPEYLEFIESTIKGGITCLQLREKNTGDLELVALAGHLLKLANANSIPLIINDRVDICKIVGAHGVHLGQSDMHPQKARTILGNQAIIGLSIESFEQLDIANTLDCIDYVSASSLFPTKSKSDYKTVWGLENLANFCKRSIHPAITIGGITNLNLNSVLKTGIEGVATISAIHNSPNPYLSTKDIRKQINLFFNEE